MLRSIFAVTLLLLFADCFSQQQIKGRLSNITDKKPIPYANIGIVNSSVGTLSNEDGTFLISIPNKHNNDTLLFSALGYNRQFIPVQSLINKSEVLITFTEKIATLRQVVVSARKKKEKPYLLGNRYTKGGFLYADSVSAGAAMALLIENKYPSYHAELTLPYFLEEVNLYINKNSIDNFKFRVRLLEKDSISGQPTKDLLSEDIIISSSITKGWIKVDMSPYDLIVHEPFYLVLEWIMEDRDRLALLNQYAMYRKTNPDKVRSDSTVVDGRKVGFWSYLGFSPGTHLGVSPIPFSLQNYTCYYRTNSFGEWKRAPVVLTARVSVTPAVEQKEIQTRSGSLKDPITESDKMCTDFLTGNNVNGIQLAVLKHGQVIVSRSYGFADVEKRIVVTPQTRFRIGSISKALTSAAILKLQRGNALDLDKPISNYLPSLGPQYHSITTRQLAGHLAGIRHYKDGDLSDLIRSEHFASAIDALKIIKNDSLLFRPGSQYHYSSYGWNIVGAVIENISGQSYLDYMSRNIWKPWGLKNTAGATMENLEINCSRGYLNTGEEFSKEDFSYKYASGGLVSTSEDLVAFGYSLLKARSDSLTNQLFQTMYSGNGKPTNYGIGWNIGKDFTGQPIYFHSGKMLNGSGYLILYPERDMVVAFLANGPDGLLFDLQKLAALFYQNHD